MSFVAPLALALGFLSVPLVLLYLLKPKREEMPVPSTFLWQQALEEVQANAPWQKLRRNLLLLLQLLILAALVLALARPLIRSADVPGGDLVLMLDTSGSMAARDIAPSRFEQAKERVRELVANKGAGRRIALISAGPTPRLLAGPTTDAGVVDRALAGLSQPYGESSLHDAAILARAIAGRLQEPTVVLVGDGGPVQEEPAPLPYPVRFESVRGESANSAVLSVSARSGVAGRELWVSLGNYGPARKGRLSLNVDDKLVDAVEVDLPANGASGVSLSDIPSGGVIEVRLTTDGALRPEVDNALLADDAGWFVDSEGPPTRVLLAGEESRFLERALSLVGGLDVEKAPTGAAIKAGYDVYILNGELPSTLPQGNLLLLAPPDSPLLPVTGEEEGLAITKQSQDSLLLRFADLTQVSAGRAKRLSPPPWMEVLASSGDVPLLVAGEENGRRVAALAFAPEDSDLPLQVAFPILVDNLMRYLKPRGVTTVSGAVSPGAVVLVPPSAQRAPTIVRRPDGQSTQVVGASTTYADTAQPGMYEVHSGDRLVSRFFVNAGSERESNVTAFAPTPLKQSGAVQGEAPRSAGRERWWPLVALALGVLLLEWWLYSRSLRRAGRLRPA